MSDAVIEISWDHGAIGKGSARFNCSSSGVKVFSIYEKDTTSFELRSGAPPNGIILPKKGTIVRIGSSSCARDVRLESENRAEAMFHVNGWYFCDLGGDRGDERNPVLMYQRWVPITGGPVPAYPVKLRKIG